MGCEPCRPAALIRQIFRRRPALKSGLWSFALLFAAVIAVIQLAASSRADADRIAASRCLASGTPALSVNGSRPIESITAGNRCGDAPPTND
jgi:hypothetical protein